MVTISFNDYSLLKMTIGEPFTWLGDSAYGPVYVDITAVTTTIADGSVASKSYVLKLADGSVARYLSTKIFG